MSRNVEANCKHICRALTTLLAPQCQPAACDVTDGQRHYLILALQAVQHLELFTQVAYATGEIELNSVAQLYFAHDIMICKTVQDLLK